MRIHDNGSARAAQLAALDPETRLRWRVAAFQPRWQTAVGEVARQAPALADLAETHPALLFALATGFATPNARRLAMTQVVAGAPLADAAEPLGLAAWTRKLPASALNDPLPAFPCDPDFSKRMGNLVPSGMPHCAAWLTAVCEAVLAGGRQYALWVARHGIALSGTLTEQQRQLLHAWVWMGWHPGTIGSALIRKPWASDLGIKRVLDEYAVFVQRIALADALGTGTSPPLIPDGVFHGFTFQTLRTPFDYITLARDLDNCLEQYGERLRRGTCAVAVISEGRHAIACVEVGPHPTESTMPAIVQLRTAKNRRGSIALWRAAYAWLGHGDLCALTPETFAPTAADRRETRSRLWGGYLADLAGSPGGGAIEMRARRALMSEPFLSDTDVQGRYMPPVAAWSRAGFLRDEVSFLDRLANLVHRPNRRDA